jgi:transketolase
MLVLRPADFHETLESWKLALENNSSPTALLLSRQKVVDIPPKEGSTRTKDAVNCRQGAYVIKDADNAEVVLVANGSEVSTLLAAAEILENRYQITSTVVSAISEGLFYKQPDHYRKKVIPDDKPVFGLTAGLPITLQGLVGCNGKVYGLDHYGRSAPFQVLDEKFGYVADNIAEVVVKFLRS